MVNGSEKEHRRATEPPSPVNLYCIAAMVADEASREGHKTFARALEAALSSFLSSLSREDQGVALRLSFEMTLRSNDKTLPRLRLVYSRD